MTATASAPLPDDPTLTEATEDPERRRSRLPFQFPLFAWALGHAKG